MNSASSYTVIQLPPSVLCAVAAFWLLQLALMFLLVLQVLWTIRANSRVIQGATNAMKSLNESTEKLGRQVHDYRLEAQHPGYPVKRAELAPIG